MERGLRGVQGARGVRGLRESRGLADSAALGSGDHHGESVAMKLNRHHQEAMSRLRAQIAEMRRSLKRMRLRRAGPEKLRNG
jgi:hypothetical protein